MICHYAVALYLRKDATERYGVIDGRYENEESCKLQAVSCKTEGGYGLRDWGRLRAYSYAPRDLQESYKL